LSTEIHKKTTPIDFYDDSKEKRDPWIKHIRRAAKGLGADGRTLPEEDGPPERPAPFTPDAGGMTDEVPEEVPDTEAASEGATSEGAEGDAPPPVNRRGRPASPPGGPGGPRGPPGRGAPTKGVPAKPAPVFRPVLPPDLGKEYQIDSLEAPPPGVFSLLGPKSKYETEEKARNEAATTLAKQKTTFDGDDVDSDENDFVENDGGLQEEGIISSSRCAQQ
jgi:hypothetical protein